MNKIIALIFLVLIGFSKTGQSQGIDSLVKPKSKKVISLSMNKSSIKDDNTRQFYGYGLGFNAQVIRGKHAFLNIGLEYNYTQQLKHQIVNGHNQGTDNEVNFHINSFSLPLVIEYYPIRNLSIEAGCAINLHYINVSGNHRDGYPLFRDTYEYFESNGQVELGAGFIFGLAYFPKIGKQDFIIGIRYNLNGYDINPLSNSSVDNRFYKNEVLNTFLSARVGIVL